MRLRHVGAATDDINQVIAGLEAQRRRQETKATSARVVAAGSETVSRRSEKQQHCRNANRHCGSNKLGGERDRSSQRGSQVIRQAQGLRQRQLPSKQRMP